MPPRPRRLVALAAAVAALLLPLTTLPGGSGAAAVRPPAPRAGAAGIGDDYFPLDGNGGIDVERYDVRIRYDLASGRLVGRTRVTLRATRALSRFNLDLLLPTRSVRVGGVPAAFRKPRAHELQVVPRRPLAAGSRTVVDVRYAGRPATLGYAGEHTWLADSHEVVAMNEPHMAPWWFPANDHPRDTALLDLRVTAPAALDVVSGGRLRGRSVHGRLATTHWRADEPMAPYLAFFAIGRFTVARGTSHGLPWYVAVSDRLPAESRRRMMTLLRRSADIVHWQEGVLGPYPFSTTGGLVTSLPVGFALENQTRPTYPNLFADGTLVVVHELAHQWFGDSVTLHDWRDIWLNEGFATIMEQLWVESRGGTSAQQWLEDTYARLRGEQDFWRLRVDDPGADHLFDSPVYVRGGMALQALRHRIGAEEFEGLLRSWVSSRKGRTGTTAQFRALAEEVSGEDLDAFFDAWLRSPRPPARTAANGF